MTVIGVIGMGQMGAGIAGRLAARGATVLTDLDGRSAASAARAGTAGAQPVAAAELADRAGLILSVVPPARAGAVAGAWMPLLQTVAQPPLYLDCNAVAPATVQAIAASFAARDLPFADGSIIGGPPKNRADEGEDAGPRLYLSGPVAEAADTLSALGLDARLLSAAIGDASALKMSYAGITKGFQALGAAMALGAARSGATEALVAELRHSQPMLYDWLRQQIPRLYPKAWRWDGEMREIAAFLQPEAGTVRMLEGAAELFAAIASAHEEGPEAETIALLDRFARARSGAM